MEALAWTAIGLFGAALLGSFGGFFYLGRGIAALAPHLGDYLRLSVEHFDPSDAEQAKGLAARQRLLRSIV